MDNYTVNTVKARPELVDEFDKLHGLGWVKYMSQDPVGVTYWRKLFSCFPEFQYLLFNKESHPVACGNAIPFDWDGSDATLPSGWDGVFEKGMTDYKYHKSPNSLSALAIVIHPDFRGKGLSGLMVREMKALAVEHNLDKMVAPVRPSSKSKYPLIPMDEYITWLREDATPFDPWIRTHYKSGASIIKVAERSMVIPASVKKWEDWTGLKLPASGRYVIKDGLVPLNVDIAADKGVYIEPNVWMRHYLDY
ncbi:GNAT family N-acetyltransferase [Virgibacillus siamensis]|uniref:GNAT family N-acetyltransferase n=1 Tax=Virgibacillus siamensis TaxID=480071 RepID=UPI0009855F74|nr:GNAT family N-acetyltransferase [Virgibacillus siamensis]